MLSKGLSIGPIQFVSPKCSGCGSRIETVPGYGDLVKGSKWTCPNNCHPENYRSIEGVRT